MNKVGYIYMTTNNINGKRYIGKRQKSEFDVSYKGSGKWLKRAFDKYGFDNFSTEVIEWCSSIEELNERERYWIAYYDAQASKEFYNISCGGDWGDISKGLTEEQYKSWGEKIRQHHTGKKHSEETKAKISEAHKGKTYSQETLEKMRVNNIGDKNPMYGKSHSDESKEKIAQALYKKVKAVNSTGEYLLFDSVKECYEYFENLYGLSRGTIKALIRENNPLNSKYKRLKRLNGVTITHQEI